MDTQPIAIDMPQLTTLVGGHLASMRNAFYAHPQDFPPAITIPGCRGVRFLMADVLAWLESRKSAKAPAPRTEPPAPRPRGRPRLAAQAGKGVRP
ncbi:hypothetical protein JKG47_08780 [Acidithiobacillus sp. MC6.1]|nr:hypothetical protein [Acidithiobacillus sp. MC6.1]